MYLKLALQAAHKVPAAALCGKYSRDRLAMFGNNQPFGIEIVEQREALFFEFGRIDLPHATTLTHGHK